VDGDFRRFNMRRINQISFFVVLGVFTLLLNLNAADFSTNTPNSNGMVNFKDTVQTDPSNLDYTAVSKVIKTAKVEPQKTKTERLNISLPDIITYFMSSF